MIRKRLGYRAAAVLLAQDPLHPIRKRYTPVPLRGGRIPTVVRQTWNTATLGRTHARYLERFRAMNSGWSFELHDTAGCDAFMEAHRAGETILDVHRSAHIGPLKSDLRRYAVLLRYGGVYCDINKMLTRPLDELISPTDHAVISAEDTPRRRPRLCSLPPSRLPDGSEA